MAILLYILIGVILIFGFVILFGAPYLPTFKKQIVQAIELLDLKPGQHLIELGCGDGRVLLEAAKRGLKVTGYEINPILVLVCIIKTWKYRNNVKVVWGNFWQKNWPPTDGIFVFLLDKYMNKLNQKIIQTYSKKVNLVSFAFKIPNRPIDDEKNGLFLYRYNQDLR
jgi:SAM-dependent methyltransferase